MASWRSDTDLKTPHASARDDGEEALDGIAPGARGGGEMEDPARMVGRPPLTSGWRSFGDDMDHLAPWSGPFDGVKELNEFLVGVLRLETHDGMAAGFIAHLVADPGRPTVEQVGRDIGMRMGAAPDQKAVGWFPDALIKTVFLFA